MTTQQVYSQSFGNRKDLMELYGPFTTFFYPYQDSSGLYNQEVYTDTNGTIYKFGEGPLNGYTGGNLASANGIGSQPQPIITTPTNNAGLESNPLVSQGLTLLQGSLIGGIPNWMLLVGVVGVFFLFGEEGHKGH